LDIYQAYEDGVSRTKIKSLDLYVKGQGHFIKKIHKSCPGHILYTVSCIIIIPCMKVRLGMVVYHIPLLGHCDLLFTVYCTSKKTLVRPITFILFNAGSSNLACKYDLGWWCITYHY